MEPLLNDQRSRTSSSFQIVEPRRRPLHPGDLDSLQNDTKGLVVLGTPLKFNGWNLRIRAPWKRNIIWTKPSWLQVRVVNLRGCKFTKKKVDSGQIAIFHGNWNFSGSHFPSKKLPFGGNRSWKSVAKKNWPDGLHKMMPQKFYPPGN